MNAIADLAEAVRQSLRLVLDPELGENVVDLGLIYSIAVSDAGVATIDMTTTTPGCPAASYLRDAVAAAAFVVPGIRNIEVQLVYEPLWTPDRMSAQSAQRLGFANAGGGA